MIRGESPYLQREVLFSKSGFGVSGVRLNKGELEKVRVQGPGIDCLGWW